MNAKHFAGHSFLAIVLALNEAACIAVDYPSNKLQRDAEAARLVRHLAVLENTFYYLL